MPEKSEYSENGGKETFARALLIWWQQNRRDFPWRKTSSPYRILITEMLLRKTTAKQVEAVYGKIFSKYPDPVSLSKALAEELEQLIRPLGMERKRAILLKAVSQAIIDRHSGEVPLSEKELLALPGIGPYAANAVLCFARGEDVPLVDTNAIRVFQRVYSLKSQKRRPKDDLLIWKFAKNHIPPAKGRDFNLAVIDLAHEICTPRKPKCFDCCIAHICDYYHSLLVLEKKLGEGERREHIIRIPRNLANIFPYNSSLEVLVGDRKIRLKLDSYGRMNPAHLLWEQFVELLRFDPDTEIIALKWKTPEKEIVEVGVRRINRPAVGLAKEKKERITA